MYSINDDNKNKYTTKYSKHEQDIIYLKCEKRFELNKNKVINCHTQLLNNTDGNLVLFYKHDSDNFINSLNTSIILFNQNIRVYVKTIYLEKSCFFNKKYKEEYIEIDRHISLSDLILYSMEILNYDGSNNLGLCKFNVGFNENIYVTAEFKYSN